MSKKVISWIGLIVIVVVLIFVFSNDKQEEKVIKIGVVAPLTGGAAGYGEPLIKGIEIAKMDFAKLDNKYEFIFEDDESNPSKSASAAQKLVNIDKVAAIITTTSGTGNAVKPIAITAKIPHICVCSDASMADNNTNFTYLALPSVEAQAWADEFEVRGFKKLAIIAQNQAGMNLIGDFLRADLKAKNISIVFDEKFEPGIKDFKTVIAKARASGPDQYLIAAFPPSLDILGQELKNLGITNFGGIGTFAISTKPEYFEGNWYTDVAFTDTVFKDRFTKAFPTIRFNARTAPYGYDVANIFVDAFESPKETSEYIKTLVVYDGKVGHVTKPIDSGNFNTPVGIWEIRGGQAVMVK